MLKQHSERHVAQLIGISKTQVHHIKLKENVVNDALESGSLRSDSKVLSKPLKFKEIDDAVFQWFKKVRDPSSRRKPLPLSRGLIQARARREAELRNICNFKASDGWFQNWRKRYNIPRRKILRGEAGDINIEDVETALEEIRAKLASFKAENVYNVDETSLFYRAMPTRSYYLNHPDKRLTGRGSKSLSPKDRITMLLCVNATGTSKVPPLLIGTAERPFCFRPPNPPCPLPYCHQPSAWCDRVRFLYW